MRYFFFYQGKSQYQCQSDSTIITLYLNTGIIWGLRAEGLSKGIGVPLPGWFGASTRLLKKQRLLPSFKHKQAVSDVILAVTSEMSNLIHMQARRTFKRKKKTFWNVESSSCAVTDEIVPSLSTRTLLSYCVNVGCSRAP